MVYTFIYFTDYFCKEDLMDALKLDQAERTLILAMINAGMNPSVAVSFIANFGDC